MESTTLQLEWDTDAAISFLKCFNPDGPWHLSSISINKAITSYTFWAQGVGDMRDWIEENQGVTNLYFHVNALQSGLRNKRAKKDDIARAIALHVDIDLAPGSDATEALPKILDRLHAFDKPPTVINFSGGGYQAFWVLHTPLQITKRPDDVELVESYNRALELKFDGDHCFNIDRLMRLPGTVNLPDERKQKLGRVPTVAYTVEADWSRCYEVSQFERVEETPSVSRSRSRTGKTKTKKGRDTTRSAAAFNLAKSLYISGEITTYEEMVAALRATDNQDITAWVEQKGVQRDGHELTNIWDELLSSAAHPGLPFQRDANHKIVCDSQENIRIALTDMGVTLSYDTFADRLLIQRPGKTQQTISDAEVDSLWLEIDDTYKFRPRIEFFRTVIGNEARTNSFHPVRDYLESVPWNGTLGCTETWLIDYGGAEDTPYVRAVSRLVLLAAVRRIRQPGVKFDEMLVLVNPKQGVNKSSALAVLAVKDEWFSDDLPLDAKTQVVIEQTQGKWIIESSELKGLRDKESEHLKAFLSRQVDRARAAFGHFAVERPREFVIIGTTNEEKFLRDTTGNRRFWPIQVTVFDIEGLRRARDQLWAEAAHLEAQGVPIRLDKSLWELAEHAQTARMVDPDPWPELLAEKLRDKDGEPMMGKITSQDVWEILGVPSERRTQAHNTRLGQAMRTNGWEFKQLRFGGTRFSAYARGTAEQQSREILGHRSAEGIVVVQYEDEYHRDGYKYADPVGDVSRERGFGDREHVAKMPPIRRPSTPE